MIALDKLIPTEDNRRERITVESVKSLGKSLKASGILQPIIVRPHPDKPGFFEIRAGERRWRAAKVAGLAEIPAIVRKLDGPTALAVTLAENIHRKDLHALEESDTIQLAFERGYDIEAIASQLGKPVEYVARRASLTRLIDVWRKAIRSADSPASRFSPAHMELIARLPTDTQQSLAANDLAAVFCRGFPSVDDLRRIIDGGLRTLIVMPWKLDDEFLVPEVGSCLNCSKRSGCHPMLFETEDAPSNGKASKSDRCLDPACYDRKLVAHVRQQESEARKVHPDLALVQIESNRTSPAVIEAFGEQVPRLYYPKFVKAETKGAAAVMPVDGPRAGKVVFVDRGDATPVKPPPTQGLCKAERQSMTLQERHVKLERRRQAFVVGKVEKVLRELVAEKDLDVLSARLRKADVHLSVKQAFVLMLSFGTCHRVDRPHEGKPWKFFDEWSDKTSEHVVDAVRVVLPIWIRRLCILDKLRVGEQFEEARQIAGLLSIDLGKLESDAERELPVPKSWANLGDGQSREPDRSETSQEVRAEGTTKCVPRPLPASQRVLPKVRHRRSRDRTGHTGRSKKRFHAA